MTISATDHALMGRALMLAARGLYTAHPNPRVGCVIAHDNDIVGEGWHERTGGPHAELVALAHAGVHARGATAYVTLEPCSHQGRTPPCCEALIAAGVGRVIYAIADPNPRVSGAGARRLSDAGLQVETGILASEARALNAGFFSRMERQRPWVRLKVAASLDGRTALASGAARWITGEAARADGHAWRARSSAVLTGLRTVQMDDPELTVRRTDLGEIIQPLRVVLDSNLQLPPAARMIKAPGETRILTVNPDAVRRQGLVSAGAVVEEIAGKSGQVDLAAVMLRLGDLGMNEVLVEAGPTLNAALLGAGLVDELLFYLAPCVLGGDSQPMFAGLGVQAMTGRIDLAILESRAVGADMRLRLAVRNP
jgi:diaminohydroxyphosphoribosylaminopyrimidine deaminase/5-amino-6-(5-phosphoribosylamino)uracil reductase